MSKKETAEKLKKIALEATWATERKKAIEALAEMEDEGLKALSEIGSKGKWADEREMALDLTREVLKKKRG